MGNTVGPDVASHYERSRQDLVLGALGCLCWLLALCHYIHSHKNAVKYISGFGTMTPVFSHMLYDM